MFPPTITNLLNYEEQPVPTGSPTKLSYPRDSAISISPVGIIPSAIPRLPSLSTLMNPNLAFPAPPHPVGLAHALPHVPSLHPEHTTPSRPEEDLLALSVARPPRLPLITNLPAPAPLEPPTNTPLSSHLGLNRYPFALGQLRPSDLPRAKTDTDTSRKRTRSEMEAAAALPELSTRAPLTSPVTEDGNPEDRNHPFTPATPSSSEERPTKKLAMSTRAKGKTPTSDSGSNEGVCDDEIKAAAGPSKTANNKRRRRKKDKRKRQRGPKNIPCPHCPVLFHQHSAVISHVRTVHYRERRFVCPKEGCGQRFGASGDVTRHVDSVHLERRPYKCEDCGNMLSRKTVLYRHIRNVHHKEPKFLEPTPR